VKRKSYFHLLAASLFTAASVVIISPEKARADYCYVWQSCWNESTSGPSSFGISVRSACYRPIYVAIKTYSPGSTRGGATGGNSGISQYISPSWNMDGFWSIAPGETARIRNGQVNGIFYYYAESDDKRFIWRGSDSYGDLHGRSLSLRKVDTGSRMEDYTLPLSCN
jgi:hypothetical protein